MATVWSRWKVGKTGCATCSNSGSAASRCRRGEGQSWFRAVLFEIAPFRRWHSGHGRLFGRPGNLRPRQGSPTSVCALEKAESVLHPAHDETEVLGTGGSNLAREPLTSKERGTKGRGGNAEDQEWKSESWRFWLGGEKPSYPRVPESLVP
jgi:hypothetical protein